MSQTKSKESNLGCAFILLLFLAGVMAAIYFNRNAEKWDELTAWVSTQSEQAMEKATTAIAPDEPSEAEPAKSEQKGTSEEAPVADAPKQKEMTASSVVETPLAETLKSKPKVKKRRAKTQVEIEAEAEEAMAAKADVPAPGSFAVVSGRYFSRKLAVDRLYELDGQGVAGTVVPDRVKGSLMWLNVVSDIFPDFPSADAWAQSYGDKLPPGARVTKFNGLK